MSEFFAQFDYILFGAALVQFILGLRIAVIMPSVEGWSRRFFTAFFLLLIAYAGFAAAEVIVLKYPHSRTVMDVLYFFESLFPSLMMVMLTIYLLHCCGKSIFHSALFSGVVALWFAYFISLCIAPFTTLIYYATPEEEFVSGPLYTLVICFMIGILSLNVAGAIHWRHRLSPRHLRALLIAQLPMIAALVVHCFNPAFTLYSMSLSICSFAMSDIILSDQIEQYLSQQREIARQRSSIMVLQMRPHFIYNTMMSIYYLCRQNPEQAQGVILDFTTYLRKNFRAIASERLIPFSEELEHTRAYLAVEQVQFEDLLFVEYDTPHTDFLMPPLTLQPIVENAVKHGLDPDSGPLRIIIRTRKTSAGSEITIENTGADFKPADDKEPHIALTNIQYRLGTMCRGTLKVEPRKGNGTVVRIVIRN